MKTTLIFLSLLLIAVTAFSAVRYVNINGGAPYYEVQPAIDASSAGDTIIVGPGLAYQPFTVDRRLAIIGIGTSQDIGLGTCINGVVTIMDNADSTELWSLWIRCSGYSDVDSTGSVLVIHSGTTGVLIARCYLENTRPSYAAWVVYVGNQSSASFLQNVFQGGGSYYNRAISLRSLSTVDFTGCVFSNFDQGITQFEDTAANIMARHCIFCTAMPINSSAIGSAENCVFIRGGGTYIYFQNGPNITFNYCGSTPDLPSGTGNIQCSTTDFVNLSLDDPRSSDYHLSGGSALQDAGNPAQFDLDSTRADIGVYGGMHPFVANGAPCYPYVLDVDVPTFVPQSGAVRIYVRGRIGSAD